MVMALFLHPAFSYVEFWLICFGPPLSIAPVLGLFGKGHKPSYYLRFFDCLLCGANEPLSMLSGDRLRKATTRHPLSLG